MKGKVKQSIQTFILDVHPKTHIRHLNGNTLDNRKSNLEIYSQNTVNDYRLLDSDTVELILRDNNGKEKATTIIDKEDLYRVQNNGFCWVHYISKKLPYAIANTPKGRLYLNKFIMNTPEDMETEAINLNTLDNRKSNLKNISLDDEPVNQD